MSKKIVIFCGLSILLLLVTGCSAKPQPTSSPLVAQSPLQYIATPQPKIQGLVLPPPSYPIQIPRDTPDPSRSPVIIGGVHVAIEGHEVVTVTNISKSDQSIGLWSVQNYGTSELFNFPRDLVLQPGESVRVHSGIKTIAPSKYDLFWSERQQWVRTGPDSLDVLLLNQAGRIIYRYLYR
jgi:hypothetical protein